MRATIGFQRSYSTLTDDPMSATIRLFVYGFSLLAVLTSVSYVLGQLLHGLLTAPTSTSRTVDLGLRGLGDSPGFTFKVVNTSAEPFIILSAEKSCGCAEFELELKTVVLPNNCFEVPVFLGGKSFSKEKVEVLIETDSKFAEFKAIRLSLTAEFPKSISTDPHFLHFELDRPKSKQRLRITPALPGLIGTFESVQCPDFLSSQLVHRTDEYMDFDFVVNAGALSSDWAFGLVVFRFADERAPEHKVSVRCESQQQVSSMEIGEQL